MSDCSITACANPHAVPDIKARALRLIAEGKTHFEVARACGTTEWQVLDWLQEAEFEKEMAATTYMGDEIMALMNQGMAPSQIAAKLGKSFTEVRLHIVNRWKRDKERAGR